jgi:hypothetical protein
MEKCPQVQAINHLIVPASPPRTRISKDIVVKVGRTFFCNYYKKKPLSCCYLAAVPWFHDDFLSHSRFLAIVWNKDKLLCTIKMLSDAVHSDLEGPEAIYR